jgi:hypothetical protein
VALGMRTYHPLAISIGINPVDLWTLGGVTYPLQDAGLACICPPNDEDSEFDTARNWGENLPSWCLAPRCAPRLTPRLAPMLTPRLTPRFAPRLTPRFAPRLTPRFAPR